MEALRRARSADRSQTGAVATNWVVLIVILWVATLGLWYSAHADAGTQLAAVAEAKAARATAEKSRDDALAAHKELSHAVGYRDESVDTAVTDLKAMATALDSVKAATGSSLGGAEAKPTLQQAVASLLSVVQSGKQELEAAKSDLTKELAARQASESKTDEMEKRLTDQLAQVNQTLKDADQRLENQTKADSARFDELSASQQTADAAARAAQQALAEFQVQSGRDVATKEAQIQALALRREPVAPEGPDGSVLSVSKQGTTAFIDIGGRDGLKRGTRFEVLRQGKAGELIPRGSIEVRDVQSDMALVGVVGEPDPFDPMLPGDLVRNPHFEKGKVNHFFLLGDFPLTLTKDFATARLTELGAVVDDKLGTGTDVLVVGDKSMVEGETGPELTDSDEYKLAEKLGMRIIRVADLAEFLKY